MFRRMIGGLRYALPIILLMATGIMPARHADAQQPIRGQSVLDREHLDYAPIGARVGAFIFDPYVGASQLFDDNIFFTPDDPTSDFISTATAGLRARLAREDLSLRLDGGGDVVRYLKNTSQSYWNAHLSLDGRYDVDPGLAIVGQIESARLAQPRDAVDAVDSLDPTIYYDSHASIGFIKNAGRFNAAATATYQRIQYEDSEGKNGTTIDNRDLDRNQWSFDGIVGYNFAGIENAFIRIQANIRDYPQSVDNDGYRDSSKGFALTVGSDFDLDGVITGRIAVGYELQAYDDSRMGTPAGPVFNLDVLWNPTLLTSVTGAASYEFEETIDGASPGYWRAYVSAGVTHELRRNLLLLGRIEYVNRDFVNSSEIDNQFGVTLGGRYLIDNGLTLDSNYLFRIQDSTKHSSNYRKNAVFIQLRKVF
jgi:hypothetical protein